MMRSVNESIGNKICLEFRRLYDRLFHRMKKILAATLACSLIVTLCSAQDAGRAAFVRDSLGQYINRALTNFRVPGAAICVVKDGKIVLMRCYGIRELGLNDRVNEHTLFMIGDNTKAFTATALAMLQADKKLNLDDPVTRYLVDFKTENKTSTSRITLRDLLVQRTGFATNAGNFTFYNTNLSPEQMLRKVPLLPQPYALGRKWADADVNYAIAGEIIPWASGKTWDAYIKENIFDPLEMTTALAQSRDIQIAPNKAVPHTIVDGRLTAIPYARLESMYAAGGVAASITDMSKWVMALINNGQVNGRQLLPNTAILATQQPQISCDDNMRRMGSNLPGAREYGMGWVSTVYKNDKILISEGRINGYQSGVTLLPEKHLGIIVMTNTDKNPLSEVLRYTLIDAYLNHPFTDYGEIFLKEYRDLEARNQQVEKRYRDSVGYNLQPVMTIDSYLGRYHNNLYGDAFITRGEGYALEMRFEHQPKMYAKLQSLGGNRFYAVFSDPLYGKAVFPFTFQGGTITGVTVRVNGEVERTPYYFNKAD
jgi:CubicO group peptidase (beta-lactamase class C family)